MLETPSLRKTQWPGHITDALGLPSIQGRAAPWHSTGDTTDLAWFLALCDYFGLDYPGERIRAMRMILEAAGGTWDRGRHSSAVEGKTPGGNVRKEAFEDLWQALHSTGLLTSTHEPAAATDRLTLGGGASEFPAWAYRHIRLRQGQPAFRSRLLEAYEGCCAVTRADVPEVLEAAHITAHAGGGTFETSNGLLLRADIHTLFDLRLLAVDTADWTVLVHPRLRGTGMGMGMTYHGRSLRLPTVKSDRPSTAALDQHRGRYGL